MKKYLKKKWLIAAGVLLAVICAAVLLLGRKKQAAEPEVIENYVPAVSETTETEERPVTESLRLALAANSDTVGWLVIPGTDTNEAVVQAEDNDYYLRRNIHGEREQWGCTFSDYINVLSSRAALHPNSILYGHSHNSEDTSLPQFTQLFRYLDEDFLKENPAFYLYLPDGDKLTFQIAAVFYTDIGFDYIEPFPEEDYYQRVQDKNEYVFENVSISPDDKLMTLSTCSYKYDANNTHNHRFVVLGKLLAEGEEPVTPVVTANPDPERPAA